MSARAYARVFVALLVGGVLLTGTTQAQTTWYVDDDAPNDPGPGDPLVSDPDEDGSPDHPFDAIQEGIDATSDGDTVLVLDGTYTGEGNKNLDYADYYGLGKAITVRSDNGPGSCVIDCEAEGRGFTFNHDEGPSSVVLGFTIQNGYVDENSPTGARGGAIYCSDYSSPTIRSCIIVDNVASSGGGGVVCMSGAGARPRIINCVIAGNWAFGSGGGLHLGYGEPIITNCLIVSNWTARRGGGVYGTQFTVSDCTITGNTAQECGGGLYCAGEATIINCIMWDDWPGEIWVSDPALPDVRFSDIQHGWWGHGNIGVDPLFVDPDGPDNNPATWDDNDYHLGPGSPCIDAGSNWLVPPDSADLDDDEDSDEFTPLDLDGEGRFFDDPNMPDSGCGSAPIVDMGAYEFGGTGAQPCFGDLDGDQDVDLSDLAGLLANYGQAEVCEGDLNCDGDVDLADLSALLAVYGTTCD